MAITAIITTMLTTVIIMNDDLRKRFCSLPYFERNRQS
jgi:hypothetical protein